MFQGSVILCSGRDLPAAVLLPEAEVRAGRRLKGPDLPETLVGLNAGVSRPAERYLEGGTGSWRWSIYRIAGPGQQKSHRET